jgi:hypothetical protein
MKALLAAFMALAACAFLTACSTHRKDLESQAPPQGLPAQSTVKSATVAISLLEDEASRMDLLSSDALAPLTEAATIIFERTGSTRAFSLIGQFANGLLAARATRAGVSGFLGASRRSVQAQITAVSGLALAAAYGVTRDLRYRDAALAAARDVTTPALSWVSSSGGEGVREAPGYRSPNIAATANAALLLKRAGALGDPGLFAKSKDALRTIYSSQAAVGRWYANVGGHHPMSLDEWGTTLFDLSADGSKESLGVLGGGVPALYANSFGAGGQVLYNSLTIGRPTGVALALRVLAAYEDTGLANVAFGKLIELRRRDGTISLAGSDDSVSQAYFALAFAQRLTDPGQGK